MLEKKRQEKIKSPVELEKIVTEILVANGREVEPFVKVFNSSGENIAKSSLGSLVGVFEIAEQSEDSAYIVNFLTSVAKKEYFSNPRRGSIESFEAALHKINLALAELVKHGNISWLGKFHGALGVLEKNNLHFSVTGQAEILLLRNGNFSEISAGLASPESHTHPIKTFVEISSGRLSLGDKIILTSPELFHILPIEDMEKNALRMDRARFTQFLRTVLINELDMAGALIIDLEESIPAPLHQKEAKKVVTGNVFSQEAFIPPITKEPAIETPENFPEAEYIDSKTGHIYIQGENSEKSEENPLLERAKLTLQDSLHGLGAFLVSQGKLLRKGKKQGLLFFHIFSGHMGVAVRKTARFTRNTLRHTLTFSRAKIASFHRPKKTRDTEEPSLPATKPVQPEYTHPATPTKVQQTPDIYSATPSLDETEEIPQFMKEKLATFYQKKTLPHSTQNQQTSIQKYIPFSQTFTQKVSGQYAPYLASSWNRSFLKMKLLFGQSVKFLRNLFSRFNRHTLTLGFVILLLLIGGSILTRTVSKESPAESNAVTQEQTMPQPLSNEKGVRVIEEKPIVIATADNPVTSVLLANEIYLISDTAILSTSEKKQYTLPAGNGKIKFASPMDDLRLIFVYTDTNAIFSWSPISHTFAGNTLILPENAQIKDIGTYLTYLYVLDKTTNQIYRFPRADGGFGAGSIWLRDTLTIEDSAKMAINETIFVSPNQSTIQAYFRGRFVKNLESPTVPLSRTSLFTHPGLVNVYAIDAENKLLLVWNQDGALITQYYSDELANGKTITVNEKTSEAFVTTNDSLLSFRLNLE